MTIQPHTIKSLNGQLERGDKAEIVRITGYSRVTVDDVMNGRINGVTEAVRVIVDAAQKIVRERMKSDSKLASKVQEVIR